MRDLGWDPMDSPEMGLGVGLFCGHCMHIILLLLE